ncbi:SUMO-specific isopeptidase USPL1 [Carlito syrichta]|uniref:SUMO-specific isopeptidase USPL1 n=1 Tax=Carlito syrichta TaxID=1868482 RepID=A0A3Q0DUH2_CARSF|nr:SUMO-specific isopeptidase USPL1 [Carlito syrichta]
MATGQAPATGDVSGTGGPCLQREGRTPELETPLESTRPSLRHTVCVQWRNAHALCWLDCILSALVHLEGVRTTVMEQGAKEESVFWRLFTKYHQANQLLPAEQQSAVGDGNCEKPTSEVFAEIEACLNEVRDEIFIRLQPQLRCSLGDMESPVFAFPLLLKMDPRVEKLFLFSFSWDFTCSQCGHQYQNRCLKSLVTFTNVIPEWHPLNAAHFGPCNNCSSKSQIRKMVLKKVSPLFMLHFVEGLPHGDLQRYAFHLEGCLYRITSVIQYQANNHFITWTADADGSWLECDDLRGPCSRRHETFEVPASEIHIVLWERRASQGTHQEAARLPLGKTNGQHALSGGEPASSAAGPVGDAASAETSSGHRPPCAARAPSTRPQDGAVACGDHSLAGPRGLGANGFLPLTFEGTTQESASVCQFDSEAFLLENKPVSENTGIVERNTLRSPASLLVSSAPAPCEEKLTYEQLVGRSVPSQVLHVHTLAGPLSAEDTMATKSVARVHTAGLTQGAESGEQFLTPQTEKWRPEQHVPSQICNLKRKETAADPPARTAESLQSQSVRENQKKPFVGSWVKGLLSRGASFMPSCVSAPSRTTLADLQPSVKGASNFGGFKTKGGNQKAGRASKNVHRHAGKAPLVSKLPPGPPPSGAASDAPRKDEGAPHGAHPDHGSQGNENGVPSSNQGDLVEGQIHKLRLKLLKKLKAKKKKLAALMSSPQSRALPSESSEHVPHGGSPNECDSIEDLLNELQCQIRLAEKSGRAAVPGVSPYTSQAHEEILAELLSPATVVSTQLSEDGETDLRYLEMGDSQVPAPVPGELNGISQDTHLRQDHDYCSPTKRSPCDVQPSSLTDDAGIRTLTLESPTKTDIFDEFFSTSALTSLGNDTLDLPHFDEYLFENC